MPAFTFPGETTLTLSVAGKTGTVAVKRNGWGDIEFSDGTNVVRVQSQEPGLAVLFDTLNSLADA